jgi:site-specific DNA-methyltransferase (adenine-specific)
MKPLADDERWRVIEGDCLEEMGRIGDVDHVITDPPYEEEAHGKGRRVKRGKLSVEPLPFEMMRERERAGVLMGGLAKRWCLVFCQAEAVALWRDALEGGGHVYKRPMIWVKPDGPPQLSGDRPAMGYESIVSSHRRGRCRWNGGGKAGVYTFLRNQYHGKRRHYHPTEKPLQLMMALVRDFTDPGDLILDPYAGSGTTGVAALMLGRRVILIEKDPKYAEIARQRMTDIDEELAAMDGEDRAYSKPRQAGLFARKV